MSQVQRRANGRVSTDPPSLDRSAVIVNLANLGDLATGQNTLSVALLDRDQRVVTRATSDLDVLEGVANGPPTIRPKANSLPTVTQAPGAPARTYFRGVDLEGKNWVADASPLGEMFFALEDGSTIIHDSLGGRMPAFVKPSNMVKIIAALWL